MRKKVKIDFLFTCPYCGKSNQISSNSVGDFCFSAFINKCGSTVSYELRLRCKFCEKWVEFEGNECEYGE